MKHIYQLLSKSIQCVFNGSRARTKLLLIVSGASIISLSELGIAKIFTDLILAVDHYEKFPYGLTAVFVLFFILARLGHYLQRVKRISTLNSLLGDSQMEKSENSWNLSLAVELTNILGYLLQIVVISSFLIYLSPQFGLVNVLGVIFALYVLGILFIQQEGVQQRIRRTQFRDRQMAIGEKTLMRVRAGEIGNLINALIVSNSLVALIFFHYIGSINTSDAVIAFLAVRMILSNLSSLSTGLMRYARALINSSLSFLIVTTNSPSNATI